MKVLHTCILLRIHLCSSAYMCASALCLSFFSACICLVREHILMREHVEFRHMFCQSIQYTTYTSYTSYTSYMSLYVMYVCGWVWVTLSSVSSSVSPVYAIRHIRQCTSVSPVYAIRHIRQCTAVHVIYVTYGSHTSVQYTPYAIYVSLRQCTSYMSHTAHIRGGYVTVREHRRI